MQSRINWTKAEKEAEEKKFKAIVFLKRSDPAKYSSYLTELRRIAISPSSSIIIIVNYECCIINPQPRTIVINQTEFVISNLIKIYISIAIPSVRFVEVDFFEYPGAGGG